MQEVFLKTVTSLEEKLHFYVIIFNINFKHIQIRNYKNFKSLGIFKDFSFLFNVFIIFIQISKYHGSSSYKQDFYNKIYELYSVMLVLQKHK